MIDTSKVQINFTASGNAEILQNVRTIITTLAGTVPFDREFGINMDYLDMPLEKTKAKLTSEYIRKIRKYEPRVKVKQITFSNDPLNGVLIPKVVIKLV